mmetsp:Transcript_4471/g.5941  ORF Transcript_4471/g.5941 Transcript_4471/m.5941 type:complete len:85 (+) Transcript_4471:772-1026(+)
MFERKSTKNNKSQSDLRRAQLITMELEVSNNVEINTKPFVQMCDEECRHSNEQAKRMKLTILSISIDFTLVCAPHDSILTNFLG